VGTSPDHTHPMRAHCYYVPTL